ncbi:MAG TPA: PIN domain nuclease [Chloroflexi bacterium]|nr:PIN domain nuclease [Chloroflexota bacterium]HCU97930.1 PIN domain nuclease [Chloroflexota bacterium]
MKADRIARILGLIGFAIGGFYFEEQSPLLIRELISKDSRLWVFPITGAILGFIVGPYLSTYPARTMRKLIGQTSTHVLIIGLVGLIIGLTIAALLAWPLSTLPSPLSQLLPSGCALLCGWLGITVTISRRSDLFKIFNMEKNAFNIESNNESTRKTDLLLDTSTIIDGRICDIITSGFISDNIIIPRFILDELQHIADSADNERRRRGRRGLDLLNKLKQQTNNIVTITDLNTKKVKEVDSKLIVLAKKLNAKIITNDYNLNKVAEIQGIPVLNINELANAVKTVCLPGEILEVKIIQEGTESRQGVGYLQDGTMVVVDNAKNKINKKINVIVTKVLQTAAGRMLFANIE